MTLDELKAIAAANAAAIASLQKAQERTDQQLLDLMIFHQDERTLRSAKLEAEISDVVAMIEQLAEASESYLTQIATLAESSHQRLTRLENLTAEVLAICQSNAEVIRAIVAK